MVFQCINIRQVPWEVLKTAAFGLGFQHLPRDLENGNAWKTMFNPYNIGRPWTWNAQKVLFYTYMYNGEIKTLYVVLYIKWWNQIIRYISSKRGYP